MVGRLILIAGDQLTPTVAALRAADKAQDTVVMAEVMAEAAYVRHHPQKIALVFSAMRHFADELAAQGWRVAYTRLDDPANSHSLPGELLRRAAETGATEVLATRPGEWRLIAALEETPLAVTLLPDDRFLCSEAEFVAWAEGRKQLRMEFFYREMRRKTGLLMEGDQPAGGQWNFDHDNRKPAKPDLFRPRPPRFAPDAITEEVLDLVAARFAGNFGTLRPFGWATTRADALRALDHFIAQALPTFGDEQDAMLADDPTLSHALISPYLNLGLLDPLEVCRRAEAEWRAGPRTPQRGRGLHPPDPRLARIRAGHLLPRRPRLPGAQRARARPRPAAALLGRADGDELPRARRRPDPRHGLCPPHPAPDGHRQLRAAGGRRSGPGPRLVPGSLCRRL